MRVVLKAALSHFLAKISLRIDIVHDLNIAQKNDALFMTFVEPTQLHKAVLVSVWSPPLFSNRVSLAVTIRLYFFLGEIGA